MDETNARQRKTCPLDCEHFRARPQWDGDADNFCMKVDHELSSVRKRRSSYRCPKCYNGKWIETNFEATNG